MNWSALSVFVGLFVFVTGLGFWAARWRAGDLTLLHEWGLGGRRFGTFVTWFLLGGDLYTAYTFIAVPALVYGAGALGFLRRSLHDPDLSVALPDLPAAVVAGEQARLRHVLRRRARALRQQMLALAVGDDGHRRDDAVHRTATGRYAGGDRRDGRLGRRA